MIKSIPFILLLLSLTANSFVCDVKMFPEIEPVADSPFVAQKKCLHSLADAPTSPEFLAMLFKQIGTEEVFATSCYIEEIVIEGFQSYVFLTDKGLRALKFPVYQITDFNSLPGDVSHFRYEGKDYYLRAPAGGEVKFFTSEELPAVADDLMTTVDSLKRKITKYENYLQKVGKIEAINVSSDPADVESVMPCLLRQQKNVVQRYMSSKNIAKFPALNTIQTDADNFSTLSEEAKTKYLRPFDELKKESIDDVLLANPLCQNIIDDKLIEEVFQDNWSQNNFRTRYETLRKRIYPTKK